MDLKIPLAIVLDDIILNGIELCYKDRKRFKEVFLLS